jgi:hypothetical protein
VTEMTSTAKLDAMMAKIQKLIAVADDLATTPEAATNYRAKAESLMREYRIAEEDLIAVDQFSILPVSKKIVLVDRDSEFETWYNSIWWYVSRHCGLRTRSVYRWDTGVSEYVVEATVVGYGSDIRYAEFLWNASRLMFATKLEPQVDPTASDQENVYALRSAGIERNRISAMIWGAPTHSNNAKVTRLYARACAERGEDAVVAGRKISAKDYREVYARSFAYGLHDRLREARDGADSVGAGIQLHGRSERVDEAFYEMFPAMRPAPVAETTETSGDGASLAKAKTDKPVKHRPMSKAERAKIERMHYSETAKRAARAGRAAADEVVIERSDRAKRIVVALIDARHLNLIKIDTTGMAFAAIG